MIRGSRKARFLKVSSIIVALFLSFVTSLPIQRVEAQDFTMAVSPLNQTVWEHGSGTAPIARYAIKITSTGGFSAAVSLTFSSTPALAGAVSSFIPSSTVTPPANSETDAVLEIITSAVTPVGFYSLTITATSGTIVRTQGAQLIVADGLVGGSPQPISVIGTPSPQTVLPGQSKSYTITTQCQTTATFTISFIAENLPTGTTFTFSSMSLSCTGYVAVTTILTLTTNGNTPAGSFHIAVEAFTSGGAVHATTVNLKVIDFTVSASPSVRSPVRGGNATFTITVTSKGGFSAAVDLTASGLPTGATASFIPSSVTPPSSGSTTSALNIIIPTTAALGSVGITIIGTTSGPVTRSTTVTIIISDFSVSVTPSILIIPQTTFSTYTVTVTSVGSFNSPCDLSVSNLPSGATGIFSLTPITPPAGGSATAVLTVSTTSATPIGTFTITVACTSGGQSRSATATLQITTAPTSPTPISPTATGTTLTIFPTPIPGFPAESIAAGLGLAVLAVLLIRRITKKTRK